MKMLNYFLSVTMLIGLCTLPLISQNFIQIPKDYPTIQQGLNAATSNTTILVSPGIYYENLIWPSQLDGIKLLGIKGSKETIIDGNEKGRVIQMDSPIGKGGSQEITVATEIQGFTIQHGKIFDLNGAGLSCEYANPTLKDLRFVENIGEGFSSFGGGAFLYNFSGVIENCHFYSNKLITDSKAHGAGLYINSETRLTIKNCIFEENEGKTHNWCYGSGLYYNYSGFGSGMNDTLVFSVINCKFLKNSTRTDTWSYGGGLYIADPSNTSIGSAVIDSCLFYGNTTNESTWSNGGGIYNEFPNLNIKNSKFFENSSKRGGGLYFYANPLPEPLTKVKVENTVFSKNIILANGTLSGSGVDAGSDPIDLLMVNTVFDNNRAVPLNVLENQSNIELIHCTFYNNDKNLNVNSSNFHAQNSIFWNKTNREFTFQSNIKLNNCLVKGGYDGVGNMDADPLMISDQLPVPGSNSPCLNNGIMIPNIDKDITGNPRPMPVNSLPDIGAYEMDQYFAHVLVKYYYDKNQNGKKESDERYLSFGSVVDHNKQIHLNFSENGSYIVLNQGFASIELVDGFDSKWKLSGIGFFQFDVNTPQFAEKVDIGLTPVNIFAQVSTTVVGNNFRCGEDVEFTLTLTNYGTSIESGSFWLDIDPRLDKFKFINNPYITLSANRFEWRYSDLYPGESVMIKFIVTAPQITKREQVGEIYTFCHGISALPFRENDCYKAELRCSFDPNDKFSIPQRADHYALIDQPLTYTIRFQNTGNDYARNVIIRDTIDPAFDLSTLKVLHSSHPNELTVTYSDSREVIFSFKNIFLPDSTTNRSGSNGNVTYSLAYNKGSKPQTIVKNTANIYFDFNPAIITNTIENIVVVSFPSSVRNPIKNTIVVYPNPASNMIYFSKYVERCILIDLYGQRIKETTNTDHMTLDVSTGTYLLKLEKDGISSYHKIVISDYSK